MDEQNRKALVAVTRALLAQLNAINILSRSVSNPEVTKLYEAASEEAINTLRALLDVIDES